MVFRSHRGEERQGLQEVREHNVQVYTPEGEVFAKKPYGLSVAT